MNKIALVDIAAILDVHPRTVLRAMGEQDSAHWAHPDVDLGEVALAYGVRMVDLVNVIAELSTGNEVLMSVKKTAEFLDGLDGPDVSVHTIRRKYPKFIWTAGVTRYLKSHVTEYYIEHSD